MSQPVEGKQIFLKVGLGATYSLGLYLGLLLRDNLLFGSSTGGTGSLFS